MHYQTELIVAARNENQAELIAEDLLSGEYGRANDGGEVLEVRPLDKVINEISQLAQELKNEMIQNESKLKRPDGTTDYTLMADVADYNRGIFFVGNKFYNVQAYDFSVPETCGGYWAVKVDQHACFLSRKHRLRFFSFYSCNTKITMYNISRRQKNYMQLPYDTLRKTVKKQLIDLNLDKRGDYDLLLPLISTEKRKISKSMLCMALTGYRQGPSQTKLLESILNVLNPINNLNKKHD